MPEADTNFSRQQTVGGSRIAGNLVGGAGSLVGVYEIRNPFGNKRADFQIISVAADGACTVWISDNLTELVTAGQASLPSDLPGGSQLQPLVFGAAGTLAFHDTPVETTNSMYMAVSAAADNIHAWISFNWTMEAVRLDFYNAVFKAQEAAASIQKAAEEVSETTSWLQKLRQIPAPWLMGPSPNKPTRQPAPQLWQTEQAVRMSPGEPDNPRTLTNRKTRG
jgi:hypothetical protein